MGWCLEASFGLLKNSYLVIFTTSVDKAHAQQSPYLLFGNTQFCLEFTLKQCHFQLLIMSILQCCPWITNSTHIYIYIYIYISNVLATKEVHDGGLYVSIFVIALLPPNIFVVFYADRCEQLFYWLMNSRAHYSRLCSARPNLCPWIFHDFSISVMAVVFVRKAREQSRALASAYRTTLRPTFDIII